MIAVKRSGKDAVVSLILIARSILICAEDVSSDDHPQLRDIDPEQHPNNCLQALEPGFDLGVRYFLHQINPPPIHHGTDSFH